MSPGSLRNAVELRPPEVPPRGESNLALRVCHLASGDSWAGAEVQIFSLVRALANLPGIEPEAVLFNDGELAALLRQAGIEVKVIPEARHAFPAILRRLKQHLQGGAVQVCHTHGYKANLLGALAVRAYPGMRLVRTHHGLPEPFSGFRRIKQVAVQCADRMVAARATDRVIAVTRELGQLLSQDVPSGRVTTIYNGIDLEAVQSRLSPPEARQRLGIAPDAPVIGTASRLVAIKRFDLLLAAARQVLSSVPAARLIIAGSGPQEEEVKAMAAALGVAGQTLFLGHRSDVYDVIRAMDVFLLASDHEGMPMVILEALALGTPIVARRVGGLPEILMHGENGILVPSDDPMLLAKACVDLLEDTGERARIGAAARRSAEGFSVIKAAQETADLYRSLTRPDYESGSRQ